MFHFNNLTKFLFKCLVSSSVPNELPLLRFNYSVKCIHSLHQSKPRNPNTQSLKNARKSSKPALKKHLDDPKVYMRNIVSNIYKILKYSSWETAQEQLWKLGVKWDSYTVNRVLKTHPPMEKAWLFFNWASGLKGFKHDQFTYTTMLDIFGEAGRISSMKYVFEQMKVKGIKIDAVTYTSLMHWLSRSGDVDGAMNVWEEMKANGFHPTVVSYTAYIKILFDNKRVKEATEAYKEMLDFGISPNCHTYTVLMEYLIVAGKFQEALEIFHEMQEAGVQPDKAACNILVEKCCKAGELKAMNQILQHMKENFLVLRYPVFLEALRTLEVAGESDALLRQVNPHFVIEPINDEDKLEFVTATDDDNLNRGLLLIFLKKQNFVAVERLLNGIMETNELLESWVVSIIIEVNCEHCRLDTALLAFKYSMKMAIVIERTAFLALIGISIRSEAFVKAAEIAEEMIRVGHSVGVYLGALLIYRLGCARRPTCAARIFHFLPDDQKCTSTYTALIGVYFTAGCPKKAIKIYKAMKREGIRPSLGTYNILLSGLERSGRVNESEAYRKEKRCLLTEVYDRDRDSVPMDEKICDLLFIGNMT